MKQIENFDSEIFHKKIGENVKRIRKEKGMSQLILSHAIGHKSVSVISNAEIYNKGCHFNLEHLGKIAYILDVEMNEFFK